MLAMVDSSFKTVTHFEEYGYIGAAGTRPDQQTTVSDHGEPQKQNG